MHMQNKRTISVELFRTSNRLIFRRFIIKHMRKHMNKIIFIPMFAIIIPNLVFASGISSNSATCNNSTLETYTGTSNLSANWTPNTINITWYNDDTQFASNSCTYGGALTMPNSIPQKTGYTFVGWRVRQVTGSSYLCNLTNQILSTSGNYRYTRSDDYYGETDYCTSAIGGDNSDYTAISCSNNEFSDLGMNEWKVVFNHGTMKGFSSCNNTEAPDEDGLMEEIVNQLIEEGWVERYENGEISDEEVEAEMSSRMGEIRYSGDYIKPANEITNVNTGRQCWCKATSYTPNGGNQCNTTNSVWVFVGTQSSLSSCRRDCARECAQEVAAEWGNYFRRALFTVH